MYFVYLLRSEKDKGYYIGRTDRIEQRFAAHQEGLVDSTRNRRPMSLVYFEAYLTKESAISRELKLKDFGSAYSGLLKRLGLS